jgi:hypothetical protein
MRLIHLFAWSTSLALVSSVAYAQDACGVVFGLRVVRSPLTVHWTSRTLAPSAAVTTPQASCA